MTGPQKAAAVLFPLFSAGISCGLIVGRSTSIDYSKRSSAERFIALYSKWKRIDSAHGQLTLRAENRVYTFTTGDAQVSKKYLSAIEIAGSPAPKVDFEKDIDKLAALALGPPAATGVLITVMQAAQAAASEPEAMLFKGGRGVIGLALAGVTLGGAAIGYYLGHRSAPDYENPIFQTTLEDSELWRGLETDFRGVYVQALELRLPQERPTIGGIRVLRYNDPRREESEEVFRRVFQLHPEIESQLDAEIGHRLGLPESKPVKSIEELTRETNELLKHSK